MNNLLIKFDKTRTLWKRSGFWGGTKILLSRLWTFFKSFFVGGGDILFVTGGVGDSALYRVHNVAEELRLHGFKTAVTVVDNPRLANLVNKFDIFVFHRVSANKKVRRMINEIKNQEKEIIFETDDLVHDPKFLPFMDYFQKMSKAEQTPYEKGIGAEIIDDPYVETCTTTTSFLANILQQQKEKKVIIVPNKLSESELELTQGLLQKRKERSDNLVRIVYASGTLSHNKDFATIKDVLLEIAKKHKNVRLVFMGPLDIPEEFSKLSKQVEIIPFSPRGNFLTKLSEMDINLVPLELSNPFCDSKSEIKFTESGALGIPTVAVRNQLFSETIEDGVDGFLADNIGEWTEKLDTLVENKQLRKKMGEKAREKVLRNYTNKNSNNQEYYDHLHSKLKKHQ